MDLCLKAVIACKKIIYEWFCSSAILGTNAFLATVLPSRETFANFLRHASLNTDAYFLQTIA